MKKFFSFTKYFWFGGIVGLLQQALGDLDNITYNGQTIIDFADIFTGLTIYATIILLVIKRDAPPKQQFRDLFLFFIGLDLFYYLYVFVARAFIYLTAPTANDRMFQSLPSYELNDFIYWTSIGLAASVWAFVATKLRNMEKKILYIIMLIPLFAVIVFYLIFSTYETIMFFITGGEKVFESGNTGAYSSHSCYILSALTALVSLIVCVIKFRKKPTEKKISN